MFDVPDIMKEFERVAGDLVQFRAAMTEVQGSDVDEATKKYLQALGKTMDEALAEVKRTLPDTVDYCRKTNEESKKSMAASKEKFEELKKTLEEAEAKAAAPPSAVPAEAIPEPEIGAASLDEQLRTYRLELLDLLSEGKKKEKPTLEPQREIWQDWSRYKDE